MLRSIKENDSAHANQPFHDLWRSGLMFALFPFEKPVSMRVVPIRFAVFAAREEAKGIRWHELLRRRQAALITSTTASTRQKKMISTSLHE